MPTFRSKNSTIIAVKLKRAEEHLAELLLRDFDEKDLRGLEQTA